MKLVLIGLSLALLLAFSAAEEQLRVMQEAGIKEMGIATASNIQKPSKTAKDTHYEQIMNYAYRRAAPSWLDPKFPTKKAPNSESCLQFEDDLCTQYNGDCAGCMNIQGCGYCNDAKQCLRSAGDNPDIEGCECEVWMNEPKQCVEAEDVCAVVNGCEECSKKPYCVWCPHEKLCMPGGFFGMANNKQIECKDWHWLRCSGMDGKTVLIVAGSTCGAILVLFFATCVIYHKCYSPVKHSAHMHDELVSSLLEDERNLLSGHDPNEPEIDPALDLRGDTGALNDTGDPSTLVDDHVTLDDDMSQSEDEIDVVRRH